mgnify:CR=1 FL=1
MKRNEIIYYNRKKGQRFIYEVKLKILKKV